MQYSTYQEISTRLKNECDLFDEEFVSPEELLGYVNSAINTAEAIIHTLYEDYFLCKDSLTLVSGTSQYDAPSDIYAHKFRTIMYNNPNTKETYEVRVIKKLTQFSAYGYQPNSRLRYRIINPSTGVKLLFTPTPQESGAYIERWYIRNAKKLSSVSDSCDIPEFVDFLYAHTKWAISGKERSPFNQEVAKTEYQVQKELMEKALSDMIPDESSNEIPPDLSFYEDFDNNMEFYTRK